MEPNRDEWEELPEDLEPVEPSSMDRFCEGCAMLIVIVLAAFGLMNLVSLLMVQFAKGN